jgi:S1-C subfamily serine protease
LNLLLNRQKPGDAIAVTLYRDGHKIEVRVTLGER